MTKNLLHLRSSFLSLASAGALAVLLTGCTTADDAVPEDPADPQDVLNIGVSISSPGLIAGSDPAQVSGAEVDIARTLAEQLDPASAGVEVQWVPTDPSAAAAALAAGDLTLMIGQISGAQLGDDIAWVGPYATVEAGLLVRQSPVADDASSPAVIPFNTIRSAVDVSDAAVCVVAGSVADGVELPVDSVTVQQTATECEVGLRSGRFDAIAADDLQLAGIQADPNITDSYDLVLWSELDADEELDLPEELLGSEQYWIGTGKQDCAVVASAFTRVVDDGVLEDAFGSWEETTDVELDLVDPTELSTQYCE